MTSFRKKSHPIEPVLFLCIGVIFSCFCKKPGTSPDPPAEEVCVSEAPADPDAFKILLIGNSLTYFNDQPSLLRSLAETANKKVFVDQSTGPGWQLEDHVLSKCTSQKISEQAWDAVILQEAIFEVAFPEEHAGILPDIRTLIERIQDNRSQTRIFYFLPWPTQDGFYYYIKYYDYETAQRMLRNGSLSIADSTGMAVAPVGWTWYQAIKRDSDIDLYDNDKSHPSYAGSYLGACVYYETLFQESILGNSFIGELDSTTAHFLQTVTTETVLDSLENWRNRVRLQ